MHDTPLTLHWFRQDLRISDNPALYEAAKRGKVLPIYILDDIHSAENRMGAASRWWLHHSLTSLAESLDGHLAMYEGDSLEIIPELVGHYDASAVSWNRCYEPWRIKRDTKLKETLQNANIDVISRNGSLLWEVGKVLKDDGTPYRVFTPFYRKGCLKSDAPREPLGKADISQTIKAVDTLHRSIAGLNLLPEHDWGEQMEPHWQIGEEGAQKRLKEFLDEGMNGYKKGRNNPAEKHVSRLSPHLHHGEISPHQVWYAVEHRSDEIPSSDKDHFQSELGWREFSYHLLYEYPDLPTQNLQNKFDDFPWRDDADALKRWQKGMTGYPMVDAGMRELWQTGYMHNRMRMVVGSFLVKNLMLHWHHGERWFWDCLVDADLANNSASWQWVAGSGADAAPYFRIFNPITQGDKFDAKGEYVRHYIPELKDLPDKYLFSPWEAPKEVLEGAGIVLGKTYLKPIVDVKESRERALEAFQSISKSKD